MTDDDTKKYVPPADPGVVPDVPITGALITTQDEAKRYALKFSGKRSPDEALFHCIACGWKATLQFTKEEMEACPDNDVRRWPEVGGACPTCHSPTIIAHDFMVDHEFVPAAEVARAERRADIKDMTKVAVETVKEEFMGAILPGSTLDPRGATTVAGTAAPAPVGDADVEGLEPRKSE